MKNLYIILSVQMYVGCLQRARNGFEKIIIFKLNFFKFILFKLTDAFYK